MIADYREAWYKIDKNGNFDSRIREYSLGEYLGSKKYDSKEEFVKALNKTDWGESEFADDDTIEALLICWE